jgi:hypothetical protein
MRKYLFIYLFIITVLNVFSQEKKRLGISYEHYFLNNSKYNLRNSDFSYLSDFRIKSNHNVFINYYLSKPKFCYFFGISFQNYFGETKVRHDSIYINSSYYNYYDLIITRTMNALGINIGIEKEFQRLFFFDLYGIVGWSIINKNYDYTPDGNPSDDNVLSHSPFFSISFSIKNRLFKTKKTESLLKFIINERFIELSGNFTIGLGVEFNFLK